VNPWLGHGATPEDNLILPGWMKEDDPARKDYPPLR
jgi:hypothetical protein